MVQLEVGYKMAWVQLEVRYKLGLLPSMFQLVAADRYE
jgi:hypothetical protein